MAKLPVAKIKKLALSIISDHPGGIRYSELVEAIASRHPETPRNTIHGSVWNLAAVYPDRVTKPSRGLFKPASASNGEEPDEKVATTTAIVSGVKLKESDFYDPFAQWLKNDLDEATTVVALGGAGIKSKWGTPDVVGVYKPLASNLIKFPLELVAAEIKLDPVWPASDPRVKRVGPRKDFRNVDDGSSHAWTFSKRRVRQVFTDAPRNHLEPGK